MTDKKEEKKKKAASWLDDMESFEKTSLETAFANQYAETYWNYEYIDLGDIPPGTTPYVRCTFKITREKITSVWQLSVFLKLLKRKLNLFLMNLIPTLFWLLLI